ncbi:universal stress protein [Sphaerisporangium sp. TRM90804]|uniref:universal stress protein n=1 Tax=Sphaerisporangium sp. TRM90804 TaxID=3031113 RepID=UPI00244828EB|nr:universal stress protein [Sphaerisporangium sp. TRM90804]MDH2426218.1 universal stress protein [Sphaerisporangium sp. TRM90804]
MESSPDRARERIVVGVDHRRESRSALSWAAAEAARRHASLIVVHASGAANSQVAPYAPILRLQEARRRRARRQEAADRAISLIEARYPDLTVHRHLSVEDAAKALLRHSRDATLLVLGSSAPDGARGDLGPVLLACLRNARCPVAVVSGAEALTGAHPTLRETVSL